MMFLNAAASLLVLTAAAQPAPQGAPTPEQIAQMPPEMQRMAQASMTFGTCVQGKVEAAGANSDVNATAAEAVAGCGTQKAAMEAAIEGLIASPIVPEAQKAEARASFRREMSGLVATVAKQIQTSRAAAASGQAAKPTK